MLTAEIAARLAGKVNGYAIDRGSMSDATDTRVCIYEYPGMAPDFKFGGQGLKYEHPSFQVVARGAATDYDGPRAVIELVVADLVKVWTTTLSGTEYTWLQPVQAPFWLRQDERNRHYFVVNFRTEKAPS
jgi:hypothetical protein